MTSCSIRQVSFIVVAIMCPAFASAQKVATAPDTMEAIELATKAAKEPIVAGYFIAGFIGVPWTLGSSIAFSSGSASPWMAVGPAIVLVAASKTSSKALPATLENQIQGTDSVYATVYRRTYHKVLSKRRRSALSFGGLTGTIGGIVLIAVTFAGYGNS